MDQKLIWGMLLIAFACLALKNPPCKHGCQTVAEHALSYGIDDLFDVLTA
jgi:hypothetical protein